ncbi:hypothetical protein ACA910_012020 [Epithemia clementina (nom. ined.)]
MRTVVERCILLLCLLLVVISEARFETATTTTTVTAASASRNPSRYEDATMGMETGECNASDGTCGAASTVVDDEECVNKMSDCENIGQVTCIRSFQYMRDECRKTCLLCGNIVDDRASNVYSEEPQQVTGDNMMAYLKQVDDYMYNQVFVDPKYRKVKNDCKNRHELCTFWAQLGECEKNPNYMQMQCAPACLSCDQLSFETRCPFDKTAPVAWSKKGDLDAMFTRIVTEPEFQQLYNITILSQPKPVSYVDQHNQNNHVEIKDGPWVVVLDDFMTSEECDTLRDLGATEGYQRSEDVGERKFDGTFSSKQSTGRTSSNAWCTMACWEHNVTKAVHDRMERLLQIPTGNYEYLQLLKYEVGQFYETHHDYIDHHLERFEGVRILTIFLYLNDVEEGGGTNFPNNYNMTVEPRKGRALLWPSVLNENPDKKDLRTEHQALPVLSGIKYGANAWIHLRDFKEVWAKGCH